MKQKEKDLNIIQTYALNMGKRQTVNTFIFLILTVGIIISMAFIFTIVGVMTMPNTGYFVENYSPKYPNSSEIPLYEGDSSPTEIPEYENDVGITLVVPNT